MGKKLKSVMSLEKSSIGEIAINISERYFKPLAVIHEYLG